MTLPMDSLESFEPRRDESIEHDPYQGMVLEELRLKFEEISREVRTTANIKDPRERALKQTPLLREYHILREKIEVLEGGDQTLHQ